MLKPASDGLDRRSAEILLATLIIARSTSYMFSKLLLQSMGQFTLLGVRSTIAFLVLLAVGAKTLRQTRKEDVLYGFLIGSAFFVVMFFELAGLRHTASVSVSFEENTAVVLVPVLLAIIDRKLPTRKTVFIFLLCGLGIVLLCFKPNGFEFNIGDLFGMLSAVSYAATIILIAKVGGRANAIRVGIFQVGTMGLLSLLAAFLVETPCLPVGQQWLYMLYLAIVCSVFGFTLQPYAQSGTTAERAGVMCALNPVTAAALGAIFLHETLTVKGVIGALLIIASIIV